MNISTDFDFFRSTLSCHARVPRSPRGLTGLGPAVPRSHPWLLRPPNDPSTTETGSVKGCLRMENQNKPHAHPSRVAGRKRSDPTSFSRLSLFSAVTYFPKVWLTLQLLWHLRFYALHYPDNKNLSCPPNKSNRLFCVISGIKKQWKLTLD